jgi:hypothetical protein
VSAIGVEYGLYQGRFWLPRVQVMEGGANVSFVRAPFKLEQKFEYANVNSGDPLPPINRDSIRDRNRGTGVQVDVSVGGSSRDSSRAARRAARRRGACNSAGNRIYVRTSDGNPDPVYTSIPCDSVKLASSPDLPGSIYDKGEETFSAPEMDDLVQQALSMGAQADFAPQPIVTQWMNPRYNRIEGLSFGGQADQVLGAGYSLHANARIGVADREPNAELTASRGDLRRTYSVTAYNRLVSASDWGNPLTLGSSISAFLFGRDEGFYYRASGLDLSSVPEVGVGGAFIWSLFAEQERTATQRTSFSVARSVHGSQFEPNFIAERGIYLGARTRYMGTLGLDPQGFRLFTDFRMEGARGDSSTYGRAAVDFTMSHGIGEAGAFALTAGAGTSVGDVTPQRMWFLGGAHTVRGQRPGIAVGNAFWLARAELARGMGAVRPVIFSDFGWAGDRTNWKSIGLPLSGAGAGISIMDGLVRFDVARGINPERAWRVDTYIEARF